MFKNLQEKLRWTAIVFVLLMAMGVLVVSAADPPVKALTPSASGQAGDINMDGLVNNDDVITLFRYHAKWEGIVVDELALDVNGDGVLNNDDVIHLFRYLAKWDVEPPQYAYNHIGTTDPTIIVSSATASAGATNVKVTVALKNNPGIASIKLLVSYDEGLTLKNIAYNSSIGGQSQHPQTNDSPVYLNWFNGSANSTGDWIFATLTFDVAANASGEYDITFTYDPNDVYNIAETNIDFDVVFGKIVIS